MSTMATVTQAVTAVGRVEGELADRLRLEIFDYGHINNIIEKIGND